MAIGRIISGQALSEAEETFNVSLRPKFLDECVGQVCHLAASHVDTRQSHDLSIIDTGQLEAAELAEGQRKGVIAGGARGVGLEAGVGQGLVVGAGVGFGQGAGVGQAGQGLRLPGQEAGQEIGLSLIAI